MTQHIRLGDIYLNYENIKKQLLSSVDEIVDAMMNDKTVELRKGKDNIQMFEVSKKKLVKIK